MRTALPGHGNTAHSAAQPLRLWFGLPVAIGQASSECATCGTGEEVANTPGLTTLGEI